MPASHYADLIREVVPSLDPRHIEAYMRLEYGTLDHLDRLRFTREARIAAECVRVGGAEDAESLARSYGL